MLWLGGSSGSVLIDLREKIKNSLTRGKLRNSLAGTGREQGTPALSSCIYKVKRVKRKVSNDFFQSISKRCTRLFVRREH